MPGWRQTQVRLSDQARAAWDAECLRHGVTLTALVEALGLALEEGEWTVPGGAVERARHLDRRRRAR